MGRGFLGTGATFFADVNLCVQLLMGAALLYGRSLAKSGRYKAHGICQASVVLLNLIPVLGFMAPLFRKQPSLPPVILAHGIFGTAAEVLALIVVAGALTGRLKNYKLWMRSALALWWTAIILGVGLYVSWYRPAAGAASAPAGAAEVRVEQFDFVPKTLTVKAGTTVTWTGLAKKHGVTGDDGTWGATEAEVMAGGYKRTFDKPGTYPYNCEYHGDAGGKGMSGVIVVE